MHTYKHTNIIKTHTYSIYINDIDTHTPQTHTHSHSKIKHINTHLTHTYTHTKNTYNTHTHTHASYRYLTSPLEIIHFRHTTLAPLFSLLLIVTSLLENIHSRHTAAGFLYHLILIDTSPPTKTVKDCKLQPKDIKFTATLISSCVTIGIFTRRRQVDVSCAAT